MENDTPTLLVGVSEDTILKAVETELAITRRVKNVHVRHKTSV